MFARYGERQYGQPPMSDIIFVCVSADIDLAETLADVFETAGHTIGDNEADARVAIVVWSHAARRSGAFLEAAKRATDAGKAIVVTRETLSAESIEGAAVFDLADWNGDPDAPAINPLFKAVDSKLLRANPNPDEAAEHTLEEASAFEPPRVSARFASWKRGVPSFGNAARAFAFVAVLAGGALSAGAMLGERAQSTPAAHVADVPRAPMQTASAQTTATHVRFAEAVTNDATLDDLAPAEPSLPVGYRGREPPSVSSLPRRERTPPPRASWRDTAYEPQGEAMLTQAAYRSAPSAPASVPAPAAATPKAHAKS